MAARARRMLRASVHSVVALNKLAKAAPHHQLHATSTTSLPPCSEGGGHQGEGGQGGHQRGGGASDGQGGHGQGGHQGGGRPSDGHSNVHRSPLTLSGRARRIFRADVDSIVAFDKQTLGDDREAQLPFGKKSLSVLTSRPPSTNQTVARLEGRGLAHQGRGEPTEPTLGSLAYFGSKAQLLRTLSTKLLDQSPGHSLPRIYTSLASKLSAQSSALSVSRKHISMSFQKSIEARMVTSGVAGSDPAQPPESKGSSKVWGRVRHAYQMAPHFGASSKSITTGRSKKLNMLSISSYELPLLQADLQSPSRSAVTPIHPFLLI